MTTRPLKGGDSSGMPSSSSSAEAPPPPPPLPRGTHTAQLIFHLTVHALLIALSGFVLPAHLMSRKLTPDAAAAAAATTAGLADTATSADQAYSSPMGLGLLDSLALIFSLPATPSNVALWRKTLWGAVQAVGLTQAWALIRFKKWYDLGRAIESGNGPEAKEARSRGWVRGAELFTLTSVSTPAVLILIHLVLILFGAPVFSDIKSTLQLGASLTLILAFPILHLSSSASASPTTTTTTTTAAAPAKGSNSSSSNSASSKQPIDNKDTTTSTSTTTSLFSLSLLSPFHSPSSPFPSLLLPTILLPLVFSLVSSSALTFDHGKAWLSWPIPPILGLFAGTVVGDLVGLAVWFAADIAALLSNDSNGSNGSSGRNASRTKSAPSRSASGVGAGRRRQ